MPVEFDPSPYRSAQALLTALAAADHRSRLLGGLGASLVDQEYTEVTVADVVRRAKVSRRTFYEHFSDLDDCFLSFCALLRQMSVARVLEAFASDPEDQVSAVLDAYLRHLASEPRWLAAYLDHLPAVGPRGVAFDREGNRQMAALVAGARTQGVPSPLMLDRAHVLIAGVRDLVRLGLDEGRRLEDLAPSIDAAARALLPLPTD